MPDAMPDATPTPARRPLRFDSLAEVREAVERLDPGAARATGRWTPAQIVLHLAESIDRSIDGFGAKAPVAVRLKARAGRAKILRDGLPAGIQVGEKFAHLMPRPDVTWDEALDHFRRAIARAERETMNADHPFLGRLKPDEWRTLHCRHAELHLGFLS